MTKMHVVVVVAIGLSCATARGGIMEFTGFDFTGQSGGEVNGLNPKTFSNTDFGQLFAFGETGGSILGVGVIAESFAEFNAALTLNPNTTVIDLSGSAFAFIVDGSTGSIDSSTSINLRFSLTEATNFQLLLTGEDYFFLSGDFTSDNPGQVDLKAMTMTAGDYMISGGATAFLNRPGFVERSGALVLTIPSPGGAAVLACAGLVGRRRRRR